MGTEHSAWALWGAWRRGPDVLDHVAKVVAQQAGRPAQIEVHLQDDVERLTSGDDLESHITGQAMKRFSKILIESHTRRLRIRVAFLRRAGEILVGDNHARRANVRHGVVLEVTSRQPGRRTEVAMAKRAVAAAIERGRPRASRPARHGEAHRGPARTGLPGAVGASASRQLENALRGWPPRSLFPAFFVVLSLAAYGALIVLSEHAAIKPGGVELGGKLNLDAPHAELILAIGGVVVAVAALFAQVWLFPAIDVAALTNARRLTRALGSSVGLSSIAGVLLQLPGFDGLFKPG